MCVECHLTLLRQVFLVRLVWRTSLFQPPLMVQNFGDMTYMIRLNLLQATQRQVKRGGAVKPGIKTTQLPHQSGIKSAQMLGKVLHIKQIHVPVGLEIGFAAFKAVLGQFIRV